MLTPEYLGSCTDYLLALYDELEEQILQDMARRIVKTGELTETADWQYKQLQEMGALQDFIYERLAEISGKSDEEIRRLFAESAYQNITTNAAPLIGHGIAVEMGLSAPMRQILEANVLRTSGNIKNLTRTIGSTGSMTYYDISNQAFMQAMSGAFSPDYAIREAIRRLGGSGVTVMFPGRKDKLDVAVRRNVRTSVAQTAASITIMQSQMMGVEYYETTAHIGARPSHAVWQGRVFKIEGSDLTHENFYDATQYGEAGGLCGVNCRHQFFPFWKGISKPAYSRETLEHYNNATVTYNGEEIPYYDATQIQRGLERKIRDTKRRIMVTDSALETATDDGLKAALHEDARKQRKVLRRQRSSLTDFCEQTGLTKDGSRVQVVGFGRR